MMGLQQRNGMARNLYRTEWKYRCRDEVKRKVIFTKTQICYTMTL